ncbi:MAG: hypothetical protein CSB47_08320 [Proteobacteria bacterium]|nr:MAG: hypothetical protein CSB47_08320 [Pseudomonadota bacterium]
MEMLTFPVLIVTFLLTLWLTSQIARQLNARNWKMPFVLVTWLVGFAFSFASLVLLDLLELDNPLKLAMQFLLPVFFSTLAYVLLMRLSVDSALTTNIASTVIGLILTVVAIVILGLPVDKTLLASKLALNNAKASVLSMITGEASPEVVVADSPEMEEAEEDIVLEPEYTTEDFLPDAARVALQSAKNKPYIEPHFRSMNIFNARRVVGMRIRVLSKDGKEVLGKLEAVRGGDLIVTLRRREGFAQVPIAMSSLKKLEVYR